MNQMVHRYCMKKFDFSYEVFIQGVRFIGALEGRSVLYPLTPTYKMLSFFPVLAFCIGVIIKSLGIMYEYKISAATLGFISILALMILMLAFYFRYLK